MPSWVQLHGAITHFPIALLIVALAGDLVAAVLRRHPEKATFWRQFSLVTLGGAFIASLPALLTGYYTGQSFPRPPAQFEAHWIFAVAATVFSGVLFLWRIGLRDKLPRAARGIAFVLLTVATFCVGYSGHLGGEMVFGDAEPAVASAPPPAPAPNDTKDEKLALAAGKMEVAAGKLDLAADRMSSPPAAPPATKNPKAPPAPKAAPPPPPAPTPDSSRDQAIATLERVAEKYSSIADKLDKAASRLEQKSTTPAPTTPVSGGKASGAVVTPVAPAYDPELVAAGAKLYVDPELGCTGCHKLNGKGGRSGPDLTHAGKLQPDVAWQKAHLINPTSKVPGSQMPAYNDLTDAQLNALATYMASLK